jgi:hypothetical protein
LYQGTYASNDAKNITCGSKWNTNQDTGFVDQTWDGGASWKVQAIGDSITKLTKMDFVDSLHGWITTGVYSKKSALVHTADGGNSWQVLATPSYGFAAISFIDTLRGWGIGAGSKISRTIDGGLTWEFLKIINSSADFFANALSFSDSMYGWAFGFEFYQGDIAPSIYQTTDGGQSWTRQYVGVSGQVYDSQMPDRYHGWAVGSGGVVMAYRTLTSVPRRLADVPQNFKLRGNYPNPFNPLTNIDYEVRERAHVTIAVYDVYGRHVRTLVNAEREPGVYQVKFDATGLASSEYFYQMKAGSYSETRRMMVLK